MAGFTAVCTGLHTFPQPEPDAPPHTAARAGWSAGRPAMRASFRQNSLTHAQWRPSPKVLRQDRAHQVFNAARSVADRAAMSRHWSDRRDLSASTRTRSGTSLARRALLREPRDARLPLVNAAPTPESVHTTNPILHYACSSAVHADFRIVPRWFLMRSSPSIVARKSAYGSLRGRGDSMRQKNLRGHAAPCNSEAAQGT